ncbi:CinA family protein [Segetibacter sp.]|jgi:PncC family amidohydrolase|uniref:CinA family protein n=1 Tax=Segetibacter sp. TaxID=2231182 RepID=UPI00261ACFBA|nr:CinA family protein [Segetibacter sp.]
MKTGNIIMIYNEETINAVKDMLVKNEETIAVAESVTAGHLQAAFSAGIDASKYFQGGITTYNLGQKARHLHVDPILCNKVNCVAQKIADTMAIEVANMFSSNYGVGITGYASMVRECEDEGLFAYFSLAYNGKVMVSGKITSPEKHPYQVQVDYAKKVIQEIFEHLNSYNN